MIPMLKKREGGDYRGGERDIILKKDLWHE